MTKDKFKNPGNGSGCSQQASPMCAAGRSRSYVEACVLNTHLLCACCMPPRLVPAVIVVVFSFTVSAS